MNKRKITHFSILLILTLIFTACGANSVDNNDDIENIDAAEDIDNSEIVDGVVSLTLWCEESNFDLMNQMISSFKQEYSNVDFDIQLVAQADSGARDAVLADVHAAGDVFSFPDDQFNGLLAAGVLMPIDNQQEVIDELLTEAAATAQYNDTLYAIPYTADNGYFLYYDGSVLSEDDVKTMDSLLAALNSNGKKLSMDITSGWYMYAFYGQTGLDFGVNDDGLTNHCNWNTTEGSIKGTDVAEAMLEIINNPAFVAGGDDSFGEGALNGTVAAGISGTWKANDIKAAWGDDYKACKLPTYTLAGNQMQMATFTGYKMFGVNYYSKNPEWAMKLAKWVTNEQNQQLRLETLSQGPANKNAANSDYVKTVPAIQAIIEQGQYGNVQRVGGSYWSACTKYANSLISGEYKSVGLQKTLDTLVEAITASAAN